MSMGSIPTLTATGTSTLKYMLLPTEAYGYLAHPLFHPYYFRPKVNIN